MQFGSSTPVAPGWWHSGGAGGPTQAANINQWKNRRQQSVMQQSRGRSAFFQYPGQSSRRLGVKRSQGVQPVPFMRRPSYGGLFTQGAIQRNSNRLFDRSMEAASMRAAQKQFMGRGFSLDDGTAAAATPQVARGLAGAVGARYQQPLMDYLQDQQHRLGRRQVTMQNISPLLGSLLG